MAELLPVNIDGNTIYIEVQPTFGSQETTSVERTVERAGQAFEQAKTTVTTIAKEMVGAIQEDLDGAVMPQEFEVEFAIKLTAEGNAFVAKAGGEANFRINLMYKTNFA